MSSAISRSGMSPQRQFLYIFTLTVAIQALHMVEHVAQVMQKFVFHIVPAHGLIGSLDLEQVHFAFNFVYLTTLIMVTVGWYYYGSQFSRHWKTFGVVLLATVVVQSYHMAEHTVKLIQFMETMMQGTPGILGSHFDAVIFHAVLNTAVFVPVVAVFFGAAMHKQLLGRLRQPAGNGDAVAA